MNPQQSSPTPPVSGDTYTYKGWLVSDRWWKRALAVVGYSVIGQLLISLVVMVLVLVLIVAGVALR